MLRLARSQAPLLRVLLRGLTVSVLLPVVGCQWGRPEARLLPPLPQDAFVQAYFNHHLAAAYEEPYRKIPRNGDDLEERIIESINSAQSSVDVAVQELRLPRIAKAIAQKHQAGVQVRVILENSYNRPWSELTAAEVGRLDERDRSRYEEFRHLADLNGDDTLSPDEISSRDALIILRDAGVPTIDDTADGSKGSGLMHHKFAIVDGRTLIVTSANFTTSGTHGDFRSPSSRGNANNLIKIESPELAGLFVEEFNLMWGDGPGGKRDSTFGVQKRFRPLRSVQVGETTVAVQFSPTGARIPWAQSVNGAIANALNGATQSIDLALFVFSEQPLGDRLQSRHQQGVQVRALIDSSFAYRSYSEGLDMMGVALADRNCRYEDGNQPWREAIAAVGVPQLPPGDRLHHKFAVIDGRTVITGSHNWSAAANTNNDETLLVIDSPVVAAHFQREFERLYAGAQLGVPGAIQAKIENKGKECPSIPSVAPLSVTGKIGSASATAETVNVNVATQEELERLPGVGPTLAARIIAARQQQRFASLDDLDRVPGIGPKLLDRLRDRVTF